MKYSDSDRRFELTGKYKGNFTIPVRDKKRDYPHDEIFITELIYSINELYFENCELKRKNYKLQRKVDRLVRIQPFIKPELVMNPVINEEDNTKKVKESLSGPYKLLDNGKIYATAEKMELTPMQVVRHLNFLAFRLIEEQRIVLEQDQEMHKIRFVGLDNLMRDYNLDWQGVYNIVQKAIMEVVTDD